MKTVEHLRELFEYNDWANRRIVVALKENFSEKSQKILAHLLITEAEYYQRLFGKDSTGFDFWQDLSVEECGRLAREISEAYEKLIRRFEEEGLDLEVSYKTSKGVRQTSSYREMLTYVLFHSAIHRGNIILKMREENIAPPPTDYIIFLRETKYV